MVAAALAAMPLSAAPQLAGVTGMPVQRVYSALNVLVDRALVRYQELGCSTPQIRRYHFTPEGRHAARAANPLWHEEGLLALLLDRLILPEWVYQVAAWQESLGPIQEFSWYHEVPWEAAVRYRNGWVMIFWSGLLDRMNQVRGAFRNLADGLERYTPSGEMAFPDLLIFVVSDTWQGELVRRAAADLGMEDRLQLWSVREGSVTGAHGRTTGYGRLLPWRGHRLLGDWPLAARLRDSLWAQGSGALSTALLDCSLEWPEATTAFATQYARGLGDRKTVRQQQVLLAKSGYLLRSQWDGRTAAFTIDNKGYQIVGNRDRVFTGIIPRRHLSIEGARPDTVRPHELGLRMGLMAHCYELGLPAAEGQRSWEHLGRAGGISPDALLRLNEGPFGPGWNYMEYELRARGQTRVEAKLRSYGSFLRQDTWPVLLVARDDRAEALFQSEGHVNGIKLLTTTVRRLHGLGVRECWSLYGKQVRVG